MALHDARLLGLHGLSAGRPRPDGRRLVAIEVKSGPRRGRVSGMEAFRAAFHPDRILLVGGDGIPLESFLERPADHWVAAA